MKKILLILTLLGTAQQSQALFGFEQFKNLFSSLFVASAPQLSQKLTLNPNNKTTTSTYIPSKRTDQDKEKTRKIAEENAREIVKKFLQEVQKSGPTKEFYGFPKDHVEISHNGMHFSFSYLALYWFIKNHVIEGQLLDRCEVVYYLKDQSIGQLGRRRFMITRDLGKTTPAIFEPGLTLVNKNVRQQGLGSLLLLIEIELAKQFPLAVKEIQLDAYPCIGKEEKKPSEKKTKEMLKVLVNYYKTFGFQLTKDRKVQSQVDGDIEPISMGLNVGPLRGEPETPPLNSFMQQSKKLSDFAKNFEKPEVCYQMAQTPSEKKCPINKNYLPIITKE